MTLPRLRSNSGVTKLQIGGLQRKMRAAKPDFNSGIEAVWGQAGSSMMRRTSQVGFATIAAIFLNAILYLAAGPTPAAADNAH